MLFDPVKKRKVTLNGRLAFALETVYDPKNPMGNIGCSIVEDVISAWLAGLNKEIEPVLHRAIGWIEQAIKEGEDFGMDPNGHLTTLYWGRAIAGFLESGQNCGFEWDKARVHEEARWYFEQYP